MDFIRVIKEVFGDLDKAGIRYALIGGFGMAMRGVQRATVDLDLILLLDDRDAADEVLQAHGYQCTYRTENVSHYRAANSDSGRIDILHAFRAPSISMLERTERLPVDSGVTAPVATPEDIIGLKIQAANNDPARKQQDWLDIRHLLEAAAYNGHTVDWELIADYLDIFDLNDRLEEMKAWHDQAE